MNLVRIMVINTLVVSSEFERALITGEQRASFCSIYEHRQMRRVKNYLRQTKQTLLLLYRSYNGALNAYVLMTTIQDFNSWQYRYFTFWWLFLQIRSSEISMYQRWLATVVGAHYTLQWHRQHSDSQTLTSARSAHCTAEYRLHSL